MLAEFICHLRKLIYLSYEIFSFEIWQSDKSLSKESKTIEFASNGLLQLKIFKSKWSKVNIDIIQDLSLKAVISTLFLFFFFLPYMYRKVWMLAFLCHQNHFVLTSSAQVLHKTSIGGQICQLSTIQFFLNLTSKSAFKT